VRDDTHRGFQHRRLVPVHDVCDRVALSERRVGRHGVALPPASDQPSGGDGLRKVVLRLVWKLLLEDLKERPPDPSAFDVRLEVEVVRPDVAPSVAEKVLQLGLRDRRIRLGPELTHGPLRRLRRLRLRLLLLLLLLQRWLRLQRGLCRQLLALGLRWRVF
jgi:hypothetical protein